MLFIRLIKNVKPREETLKKYNIVYDDNKKLYV